MSTAFAIGVGTKNSNGEWLEVFYQQPIFQPSSTIIDAAKSSIGYTGGNQTIEVDSKDLTALATALTSTDPAQAAIATSCTESQKPVVITILETDEASQSTPEVYLKLHLLSHRLVKPHGIDLSGMFGLLPNVAWTNQGAI
ncbi:MAG: 2,3,4,5-tetrahydropyridine-2,6-dicarboxylate N-succinyltransferase, partial [Moraxellaceae bacterium]